MSLSQIARKFGRGSVAYIQGYDLTGRIYLAFFAMLLVMFVGVIVSTAVGGFIFNHRSPGEHLKRARAACGLSNGVDATNCPAPDDAFRELWAIPRSASEYPVALSFLTSLQRQHVRIEAEAAAKAAQIQTQALNQMEKNRTGQAHDNFTCANSTEGKPIMSFDDAHWWVDDGRCADRLRKAKDADAETSSYISSTIRVDTDMDSFWLPDEERTCQSFPDDKGKVSMVACNQTGSHRDHNIPVKFWGGVERNTVSNWKCRREKNLLSDEFVCRAID